MIKRTVSSEMSLHRQPDLEHDHVVAGHLRSLRALSERHDAAIRHDEITLHAAAARLLLIGDGLQKAASPRGIKLVIQTRDVNVWSRVAAAKSNDTLPFYTMGNEDPRHGVSDLVVSHESISVPNELLPIELSLGSFMKQRCMYLFGCSKACQHERARKSCAEFPECEFVTRHDAVAYIANKMGGTHYDKLPGGSLSEGKLRTVLRCRKFLRVERDRNHVRLSFGNDLFDADPGRELTPQTEDAHTYVDQETDAVVGLFMGTIRTVVRSESVRELENSIEADLGRKTV